MRVELSIVGCAVANTLNTGLWLMEGNQVTLDSCTISKCPDSRVEIQGRHIVVMVDCKIFDDAKHGTEIAGKGHVGISSDLPPNAFFVSVTERGNYIPGLDMDNENGLGGVCPSDLAVVLTSQRKPK